MGTTGRGLRVTAAACAILLGSCGGGGGGGGGSGDEALALVEVFAGGTVSLPFTTASITIGHGTGPLTPGTVLFESTLVSSGDSGIEFDVAEGDDPDFGGLAAILTNGADDFIGVEVTQTGVGSIGGFGQTESSMLALEAGTADPDLAGFHITRVRMFLRDFSVNPATGQYTLIVTFAFYGRPS